MNKIAINSFFTEIHVTALNTTIFGIPAVAFYAAIALIVSGVLLKLVWPKKGAAKKARRPKSSSGGAVQDFMSTMKLSDTQRIDRLHRVVTLSVGGKVDLKELSFDRLTKFAISFGGFEHERGQDFARIKLELGGASADCGASVKEVGDNDFLVPRAAPDDPRCVIHYMSGRGDAVSFLQVKVQKIDPVERSASIDVLHLRGRQAA